MNTIGAPKDAALSTRRFKSRRYSAKRKDRSGNSSTSASFGKHSTSSLASYYARSERKVHRIGLDLLLESSAAHFPDLLDCSDPVCRHEHTRHDARSTGAPEFPGGISTTHDSLVDRAARPRPERGAHC